MPVTRSRTYLADIGLEDNNKIAKFLFDEESIAPEAKTLSAALGYSNDLFSAFRQAYPSMVSLYFSFLSGAVLCPPALLFSLSWSRSCLASFWFCHLQFS